MINLGRSIVFLLDRYERIPVAGLGAFVCSKEPSSFDPTTGAYHLGSKNITFDSQVGSGQNDQLLVNFIAAQRGVDQLEAQSIYRKAITKLLNELEDSGNVRLDGLGTILLNGNEMMFEAEAQMSDPLQYTGGAVKPAPIPVSERSVIPVIEVESPSEVIQAVESEREIAPVTAPEDLTLSVETAGVEVEEEVVSNGSGVFWKGLLIGVLVLTLVGIGVYFLRPDIAENMISRFGAGQQQILQEDSLLPEEDDKPAGEVLVLDSLDFSDELAEENLLNGATETMESQIEEPTVPKASYEIVVGSFATMEQAEKFVDQMKQKGISVRAIESRMPGNRKKVSYGSYASEAEAYRALPEVQKTVEPTAWVARVER